MYRGSKVSPGEGELPAPRYRDIRFCPRCGVAYRAQDFYPGEYLFLCSACDFDFYQNPLPSAVVVLAHPENVDTVLVIKRRTPPGIGRWCLPGGFIRYGETPDAAAAREAREEVGVAVEIGSLLRVGVLDYPYRGRRVCVLEVAFVARLACAPPTAGQVTAEASEVAFRRVGEMLDAPETMAFPEHAAVLREFQSFAASRPGSTYGKSSSPCATEP